MDDLTVLEVINLINIGITSHNIRQQVPNDLPTHGQFIDSRNLKSKTYIYEITKWTENQQMIISEKKTKAMVVNFTEKYQFHTRLHLKGQNIEVVDKMKVLGTIITRTLNWDENCTNLIKKVNNRMQLLRKFGVLVPLSRRWFIYGKCFVEVSWNSHVSSGIVD